LTGEINTKGESYKEVMVDPTTAVQREVIYNYIEINAPVSRRQISGALNITINAVCGRVDELLKANRVYVSGTERDPKTRKRVQVLSPVNKSTLSRWLA